MIKELIKVDVMETTRLNSSEFICFSLFICVFLSFVACVPVVNEQDAKLKALETFHNNETDFSYLGSVCDSISQKYPRDRFDFSYSINSASLLVIRRFGDNNVENGKYLFEEDSLHFSYAYLTRIFYNNRIATMNIDEGVAEIGLKEFEGGYREFVIVYSVLGFNKQQLARGSSDWCDSLAPNFYFIVR